jgi:cathepsin D
LIDIGSADVFLNPGLYTTSPVSENLNKTFNITFGTTNTDGSGTETVSILYLSETFLTEYQIFGSIYKDIVCLDRTSLSVPEQAIGEVTIPTTPSFSYDGLIGFGSPINDVLNSTPWFQSLCEQSSLDECRFGLAFQTDGTGEQYFGNIEHDRFKGRLSTTSLLYDPYYDTYFEWATYGDIAANGKVIAKDSIIEFDSGTTVIFGLVFSKESNT